MTINGRLLLLVVATGLFVRVWTVNDRAARGLNPSRSSRQVVRNDTQVSPATFAVARRVACRSISSTVLSTPSPEEAWTSTSCPIPLPAGVISGAYRVVNDMGRVARLDIAPSLAPVQNASAPVMAPEFYVTTIGSRRWYFIRLQLPVDQQPTVQLPDVAQKDSDHSPAAIQIVSPCTNRKFDFTGYVTTNGLAEPAIEEIAFPEPPDMPVPR